MANVLKIKRGSGVPSGSDLAVYELGYRTGTNELYINDNGTYTQVGSAGSGGGDIEGVTAGSGLDGGGTSGTVTLSVDVSDFMANGVNNYVLTATGTDAFRGEGNLTFDGSTLAVTGAITGSSTLNVTGLATFGGSSEIQLDAANTRILLTDNTSLKLGTGGDFFAYHDGTNTLLRNNTGHIYFDNLADDKNLVFRTDDGSGGVANYMIMNGASAITTVHKLMRFDDNVDLRLGAGSDLRLYHTGSHSYMLNYTGDLVIRNTVDDKDVKLESDDGSGGTTAYLTLDGSATAIKVAKNLEMADNVRLRAGSSDDLQLYHDTSNSYITNATGDLVIRNDANDKDIIFQTDNSYNDTTNYLQLDGSELRATFNVHTRFNDSKQVQIGSAADLKLQHDGTNSYIDNGTGMLFIRNTLSDQDIRFTVNDGGSTTNLMTLNSASSRVGIGTTAPADHLHVYGTSGTTQVRIETTADAGAQIRYKNDAQSWINGINLNNQYAWYSSELSATVGMFHVDGYFYSYKGIRLSTNNTPLQARDAAGNLANLMTLDTGDILRLGDTDHIEQIAISTASTTNQMILSSSGISMSGNVTMSSPLTVNYGATINEGGHDSDTRIESDGNANMFRVDASANRIGIGTGSPSYDLHVAGHAYASSSFLGPNGSAGTPAYRFHNDGNSGMFLLAGDQVALSSGGYYITLQGSNELNYYNSGGSAAALYINHHASNSEVNIANSGAEIGQTYGVRVPDGSAGTPTFSFTGDTNTGMLTTASDTIGFSTGGSTRFTMDGTGILYVSNKVQAGSGGIEIWDATHGFKNVISKDSTYTKLLNNDGTVMIYLGDSGDGNSYFQAGEHRFRNLAGSAYYARIGSGYIRGEGGGSAGTPQFSFQNDTNTGVFGYAADQLGFSTAGTTRMVINNNGPDFINTSGLYIDNRRFFEMRSNSNDRGQWNPIASNIRNSGIQRHFDEEFEEGTNGVNLYNNAGGSNLVVSRITASADSLVPPNKSGKVMKIAYNGNGTTSPNFGGIYQTISSEENHTFVQLFQAKLPDGRYFVINENPQGTRNTSYWMTDKYGTGKWEWYVRVSHCGDSGTFSSGGHISVAGGADSAFNWYIASMTQYDVTESPYNYTSAGKGTSGQLLKADGDGTYSWQSQGGGSNLDADKLDGIQASQFLRSDTSDSVSGNVTINGNLTVANGSAYAGDSTSGVLSTGSWYGDLGSNGFERVAGVSHDGGEFVIVEKGGRVSTLVDGNYFAYESANGAGGGFFSSTSSSYANAPGIRASGASELYVIQWDGGVADLKVSGNLVLPESKEIRIGDGQDLRLIHAGNSFMDNYAGHLYIRQHQSDHDMFFQVNDGGSTGQTVMCIDGSEQRIGIGTTSPGRQLSLYGEAVIRLDGNSGDPGIDFNTSGTSDMQIRYRGSSDKLQVYSYGNSANVMTIQKSNGYVGIGTESPGSLLTVYKDGTQVSGPSTSYQIMTVSNSNGGIAIQAGASSDAFLVFGDYGQYDAGRIRYDNATHHMDFCTGGNNPRMTIQDDGHIAITNTKRLIFDGVDGNTYINQNTGSSSRLDFVVNGTGVIDLYNTHLKVNKHIEAGDNSDTNGVVALAVRLAGDDLYNVWGSQYSSGKMMMGNSVKPRTGAEGFISSHDNSASTKEAVTMGAGLWQYYTAASAQTTTGDVVSMTERVRFDISGNGHFDADVVAYSSTVSDERLKDNIQTIPNALDKVMQLRGVEFDWNATSRKGQHDIGVIAQEVEEVLPEVVKEHTLCTGEFTDNEKEFKTVDYDKMIGVLIEAVKQQQEEIELLKANYDDLKYNRR